MFNFNEIHPDKELWDVYAFSLYNFTIKGKISHISPSLIHQPFSLLHVMLC